MHASHATIRRVAKYARKNGKKVAPNISEPYTPVNYRQLFIEIYDHNDFFFGNEIEFANLAYWLSIEYTNLNELAGHIPVQQNHH